MKRRTWSLLGAALLVACLIAVWRVRAASRAGAPEETPPPVAAASQPAPATPPPPPPSPPRRPTVNARDLAALDEARLMARLRSAAQTDPPLAIALAREGNRRFPDSADAPERTSILVHALAATGQSMQARGEAEAMVNRYPDSQWVREVEQFTGAHRHRNVRVNDAGQLEFYDAPNR
ncbi:MAG TPA: hypothetical protein VMT03_14180 [Polyangia bacterium]|nr:hypothetical protein [Polyangia bacterium]